MLILTTFYLVGVYLVLALISRFAPLWVRFATGASVLVAMGFTVQLLAAAMSGMAGVARYVAGQSSPVIFVAAQALLVGAHGCMFYALNDLLNTDAPASHALLLLTLVLYLAGVTLSLYEWKHRKPVPG